MRGVWVVDGDKWLGDGINFVGKKSGSFLRVFERRNEQVIGFCRQIIHVPHLLQSRIFQKRDRIVDGRIAFRDEQIGIRRTSHAEKCWQMQIGPVYKIYGRGNRIDSRENWKRRVVSINSA